MLGLDAESFKRRGYGSMVEPQPSKLMMRVRFPLPAPGRVALRQRWFTGSE